jgi:hypothetical protein
MPDMEETKKKMEALMTTVTDYGVCGRSLPLRASLCMDAALPLCASSPLLCALASSLCASEVAF